MQQERVIFLLLIGSLHSSEIKRFMLDDENPHAFCFRFSCFIFPLNNSLVVYLRQGIHSIAQNEKQNIIIPQIRKILGHLSRKFHLLFLKSIYPLSFFLFSILITFTQQLIQTKVSCLFSFFYYVILALFLILQPIVLMESAVMDSVPATSLTVWIASQQQIQRKNIVWNPYLSKFKTHLQPFWTILY